MGSKILHDLEPVRSHIERMRAYVAFFGLDFTRTTAIATAAAITTVANSGRSSALPDDGSVAVSVGWTVVPVVLWVFELLVEVPVSVL